MNSGSCPIDLCVQKCEQLGSRERVLLNVNVMWAFYVYRRGIMTCMWYVYRMCVFLKCTVQCDMGQGIWNQCCLMLSVWSRGSHLTPPNSSCLPCQTSFAQGATETAHVETKQNT